MSSHPRKFKSCFLFLADGARADVFERLMAEGRLPNLKAHLLDRGTYVRAITAFPSTTGPAHMAFLTGCFPATCDVPGIRWFDRKVYAERGLSLDGIRSYVGFESYLMNRDTRPEIRTLFEIFERSVCIFSPFNRGVRPPGNRTSLKRAFFWGVAHTQGYWKWVDRNAFRYLLDTLPDSPEFVFVVFPAIDTLSHRTDPFSERVLSAYEALDAMFGRFVSRLRENGTLDETLLICTSDHGLTATHTHFPLATFLEDQGVRTLRHPMIFKRNFKAAVMVSGNAMAHVYLKNGHGWAERARYEDLSSEKLNLIDLLSVREEVAWTASLDREGRVVVHSKRGRAFLSEDAGLIRYEVEGSDPFHYEAMPKAFSYAESLELTAETEYPDAPVQLLQIFRSRRTGDLVVCARKGYDLRLRFERPEHRASHGSLVREHMTVPFLVNCPLVHPKHIRTVDVFPTVLRLMGREHDLAVDGRSLAPAPVE